MDSEQYIKYYEEQGQPKLAGVLREIKDQAVLGRQPDFDSMEEIFRDCGHFQELKKQVKFDRILSEFMYILGVERSKRMIETEIEKDQDIFIKNKEQQKRQN